MMSLRQQFWVFVLLLGILPALIKGLEVNEGETLTLTCPRPSRRLPVIWQGPPKYTQYTRGLTVSLDLTADLRSRLSLSGDHGNGYYNLQIESVLKSDSGEYRCKIGSREIRSIKVKVKTQAEQNQGLFPYILNLATRARISANATCGKDRSEYFCKLVEHVDLMPQISHCDYCNARAGSGRLEEVGAAHPINQAIDGSNKWWQSPSISNGWEYNYVTITLDLGLIYQVAYVVVKAANAPRPGNWILEKSVDGINYAPWQYFAITDDDCERIYNIRAVEGKPSYDYLRDDEVRCTSYFSKLNPLENGEIFISLTNGRPGIFVPSKTLLIDPTFQEFTSARYVRLRFQKIRTLNADLMSLQARDPRNLDPSVTRRYFYSVKDISIGGQCICYGHANECQRQGDSDSLACVCQHNTCGTNCEICCPLFNNKAWVRGGSNGRHEKQVDDVTCEACNCHGHADACVYNATVDLLGLSMNMDGKMEGGGVCIDCKDMTTGVNCERCLPGYYRPWGVSHNSRRPCRECRCEESVGSTGVCVEDDSRVDQGLMPGSCICREGFAGQNCDQCAVGYHSYPRCEPCSCSTAGTVDPNMCEGRCVCKENVDGVNCDKCKAGFYDLSVENPLGCRQCFCFGISTVCQSAGLGLVQITDMSSDMDGWTIITLNDEWFTYFPTLVDGWLEYRTFPARDQNFVDTDDRDRDEIIYYWQAPVKYYGNRLASYGGELHYIMMFTIDDSAPWQNHLAEADVILQGGNITVTNGRNYIRETQENKKSLTLDETQWFELDPTGKVISQRHVTRKDFMLLLFDLRRILIRATHHTAQDNVMLKAVLLDTSNAGSTNDVSISGVEKCSCPRGYTGLSCESCDIGWRRVDNVLYGGQCVPCECYGHSKTCDSYTGRCLMCTDNTEGEHCDVCRRGYYGDPTRGTPEDCQPCACPLNEPSNNFATTCALSPKFDDPDAFICLDCQQGYTGERCERCDHGYYGYPGLLGDYCQQCQCNGNIDRNMVGSCDQLTGECRVCLHNTEGPDCGKCRVGYYGTAVNGDCKLCNCDPFGSTDMMCDKDTGACNCKEHYTGRQCDRCEGGYGDIVNGCKPCNCSRVGSLDYRCHPITGQCVCRPGVTGITCDHCQVGFYGYSSGGCRDCRCYRMGANSSEICDLRTGRCNCLPFVEGVHCDSCEENYWGIESGHGCTPCDCDPQGSYFAQCDSVTGQCRCKQGVTGQKCEECEEGFYGLISRGECLECEPCTLPGHICHPDTGECVCPPNTEGERCEQCIDTYWGYDPRRGCMACDCDGDGSLDNNCDPLTGQCVCKADYTGLHCDQCLFGFYNFPDCTLCLCSVEGTEPESCSPSGACSCSEPDGQCNCKENTVGRTCQQCVNNSFSLDVNNPDGCTECFCFDRSNTCEQAKYVWTTEDYPDLSVSFSRRADSYILRQQNGFFVIPDNTTWTSLLDDALEEPVYWSLPGITGDMTLSYSGVLSFTLEHTTHGAPLSELVGLVDKPLVVLVGYGIPVMFRSDIIWDADKNLEFSVRLHQHYWRTQRNGEVSREMMMVILQNVTEVLVRATWDNSAVSAKISKLKLERAVDNELLLGAPAMGIEQCVCPPEYTGLSCQDPAEGYYRVPHVGPIDNTITDLVDIIGEVRRCECNSHSDKCNPETGYCIDCVNNTAGPRCDVCIDGYYGDPTNGSPNDCQRCACPLEISTNNFSPTCVKIEDDLVCTACEEGYSGTRCEYCSEGYYGDPSTPGDSCKPCNCNPEGSVTQQCDYEGRCQCLPGITGDKCDQCQERHAVVQGQCVSCDEGCTRELMMDMDDLEAEIGTLKFDPSNVNITGPYRKLNSIRNETRILSERLKNWKYKEVVNIQDQLNDLEPQVDAAIQTSENVIEKSEQNKKKSRKLMRSGNEIDDTIKMLKMNVEDLVNDLEISVANSYHNRSGINVTQALADAKEILAEIKARDFSDMRDKAQREHDLAEELSERILLENLRLTNTTSVENRINRTLTALDDLLDHVEMSAKKSEETMDKVKSLKKAVKRIKEYAKQSRELNKNLKGDVTNSSQLIDDAKKALNMTEENVINLEARATTLEAAIVPLEEKVENLHTNLPDMEILVQQAIAHANNLSKTAEDLEQLFTSTRQAAEDPVRAARVYQDIVDAVEEAAMAAKKAIADAEDATDMFDFDELKKKVEASLKRSKELRDQANRVGNSGIGGLDDALEKVNDNLDGIDNTQLDTIDSHTEVKQGIDNLPTDTVDRIANVNNDIDDTETVDRRVNDRTGHITNRVNNEMMPKLRELQNIVGDSFNDLFVTVSDTKNEIMDIKNVTDSLDGRIQQSHNRRSELRDKLSKLKQSIREAREEANKVKTSLQSSGKCVKQFRSLTQPGTINSISFAFKTSEPEKDMLMVLVQNQDLNEGDTEKEFLAVELRNRKVRFTWNAGGGVGNVEYDVVIQSEDAVLKESDKWYKVEAERIGGLGRLVVHQISKQAGVVVTDASPVGYSVMGLDENADVFVSGVPANYQLPLELTQSNFSGCMGSMFIDNTLVGLFNFQTNTMDSCSACLEVPTQTPGASVYSFDGSGYAVADDIRITSPLISNVVLDFKTYWDNASLFFVGNPDTGEFLSVELEHGHVVFNYYLGEGSFGRIMTEYKYNRNDWVSVAVARSGLIALIEVGKEKKVQMGPDGDHLLDVSNNDIYFGGVPPTVDMDLYREAAGYPIISDRFLGCMKSLQVSVESVNLWEGKSTVGVSEGCKESGFRSVGFYGSGFAEYQGVSLGGRTADLSISFSTTAPNALLLLAKNVNGDNFYSLIVKDGLVVGKFSGGGSRVVTLSSQKAYNDDSVHNVAVKKSDRKLEIFVDDILVDSGRLGNNNQDITVREDGGLYLGGVPEGLDVVEQADTSVSLDGCLSDVVINRVILNINQPKQYDKADIGRCSKRGNLTPEPFASDAPAPLKRAEEVPVKPIVKPTGKPKKKTPEKLISDMPAEPTDGPVSCTSNTGSYQYEKDGVTFGDVDVSYNPINVAKKEMQRNFEISFEFRTYYPDGLLFYLSNLDHTAFIAAQIKNGDLMIVYDRKSSIKEVTVSGKSSVADGDWHLVKVTKKSQRIEVTINGGHKKGAKISKVLKTDVPLFVGGVPNSFITLLNSKVVAHSIRGCLRRLSVNNDTKKLGDDGVVTGVNKCFTKVEQGAHFTGISYGVYKKRFVIGEQFTMDLEFKSAKPEGILATVSNSNGRQAMTLQVHNGQIKFIVINSGGQTTVSSTIDSQFSLCDNMWHKVKVTVSMNVITLQVDGGNVIQEVTTDDVTSTDTRAALYLGGKPGSSIQAAALTELGFDGCLKNFNINSSPVNWFDLEESVAIQKTSCPMS